MNIFYYLFYSLDWLPPFLYNFCFLGAGLFITFLMVRFVKLVLSAL